MNNRSLHDLYYTILIMMKTINWEYRWASHLFPASNSKAENNCSCLFDLHIDSDNVPSAMRKFEIDDERRSSLFCLLFSNQTEKAWKTRRSHCYWFILQEPIFVPLSNRQCKNWRQHWLRHRREAMKYWTCRRRRRHFFNHSARRSISYWGPRLINRSVERGS